MIRFTIDDGATVLGFESDALLLEHIQREMTRDNYFPGQRITRADVHIFDGSADHDESRDGPMYLTRPFVWIVEVFGSFSYGQTDGPWLSDRQHQQSA